MVVSSISAFPKDQSGTSVFDESFDTQMSKVMDNKNHPLTNVALTVVHNDQLVFNKTYGNGGWTVDSTFAIQSITKSFTAVAILQLYEQNLLNLSDDINNYLSESMRNPLFPNTPITIHHLLTHQSGMEGLKIWLDYEPGEEMTYSGYNFELLTQIIDNITSQSHVDYVNANILTPLGIPNSTLSNLEKGTGLVLSSLDIIPWILVHLNNGTYGNETILSAASIQLMHATYMIKDYYLAPPNDKYKLEEGYGYGWVSASTANLPIFTSNVFAGGHFGANSRVMMILEEYDAGFYLIAEPNFGSVDEQTLWNLVVDAIILYVDPDGASEARNPTSASGFELISLIPVAGLGFYNSRKERKQNRK
jgi:CubicO group peptidase (beta-lactamase class C family)